MSRSVSFVVLFLLAASISAGALSAGEAEPVRLTTEAFGRPAVVEVRDLPAGTAETAARAALEEVLRVERLSAPQGPGAGAAGEEGETEAAGVARLNARAGTGPQPVGGPLLRMLEKTREFCLWSRGTTGPLGGRLHEIWGAYRPVAARPSQEQVQQAVEAASCGNLSLDREAGTVSLAAGSRLDLSPFAAGWAADRAVEVLAEYGAGNAYVEVGRVRRGVGAGPGGHGWKVTLPVFAGSTRPLGEVRLRDRALALAHFEDRVLEIAGDRYAPYFDQRQGRPATGVVAVIAVTELGLDAQGLAGALFVLGNQRGHFLLGKLRPAPSVRWLLGSGEGVPLITDYNWSELRRR